MSSTQLAQALSRLKERGYKSTRPRRAILEILLNQHGPFSVEEIQSKLKIDCDTATIYRNISTFQELNIVSSCDFQDGVTRYEWSGPGHHHHHHIICRQCTGVEALEICFVKELETLVQSRGYQEVTHRLEFYGICQKCQKKNNKASQARSKTQTQSQKTQASKGAQAKKKSAAKQP